MGVSNDHHTQQKLWQFSNVFGFANSMCAKQCTKFVKLAARDLKTIGSQPHVNSKFENYLFTTIQGFSNLRTFCPSLCG